jgi:uncharacterized protein (DUF58 family)
VLISRLIGLLILLHDGHHRPRLLSATAALTPTTNTPTRQVRLTGACCCRDTLPFVLPRYGLCFYITTTATLDERMMSERRALSSRPANALAERSSTGALWRLRNSPLGRRCRRWGARTPPVVRIADAGDKVICKDLHS